MLLLALGLLASCSNVASLPAPNNSTYNGYVLTVKVDASDTPEAIAAKFGGEVVIWRAEDGFAILKLSDTQKEALRVKSEVMAQAVTLDPNTTVKGPELDMQGVGAWSGGIGAWSGGYGAWSGGWNTWGGGWNTWSGGTTYTVPELPSQNRYLWNMIRLPQAQGVAKNFGSGIKVAVLDTGIDLSHPAFQGRLAPNSEWKDFVDGDTTPAEVSGTAYGHGTGVAGIIAQVAPKATILPLRVLGADGSGSVLGVVDAINWAIQKGAKVINISLGLDSSNGTLKNMVDFATSRGVYIVASAGNASDNGLTYPAEWAKTGTNEKYLLSVGSTTIADILSLFSNYGTSLEFVAPGELVFSAYPGSQAAYYIGTSFAAPQVAGALAAVMGDTASTNWGNLQTYLSNGASLTATGLKRMDVVNLLRQAPDFVQLQALYVSSGKNATSSDTVAITRLRNMGYNVIYKQDSGVQNADTTGKHMVVISGSASATVVSNQFKNAAVPVVVGNADLFDDMKMTGTVANVDYSATSTGTSVSMTNAAHPLAAGMLGARSVFNASDNISWGKPSSAAFNVGTLPTDSSKPVLFGYNTGSTMVGLTAPARRVGYFAKNGLGSASHTGSMLFEAAVTWALSGN